MKRWTLILVLVIIFLLILIAVLSNYNVPPVNNNTTDYITIETDMRKLWY